jgi:Glycosyl hydrolase catalytic core
MKAVNPNIQVLHSGLAAVSSDNTNQQISQEFFSEVYATIGPGYFDIMNYHFYGLNLAQLQALQGIMGTYGEQNKPIWITEYGCPTTGNNENLYLS